MMDAWKPQALLCLKAEKCPTDGFKIQAMSAGVWQNHSTTPPPKKKEPQIHPLTHWLTDYMNKVLPVCLRLQLLHESLSDYEPKKKMGKMVKNKMNNKIKRVTEADARAKVDKTLSLLNPLENSRDG